MFFKKKGILFILTVLATVLLCSVQSFCLSLKTEEASELYGKTDEIVAVSHRGDTANFPENSLEAVLSAEKIGADMVSVSVQKTSDGIYVLCENEALGNFCNAPYGEISQLTFEEIKKYNLYDNTGSLTEYKIASLSECVEKAEDIILILDFDWEEKDGIYQLLCEQEACQRVCLRTKESAGKIKDWVQSKDNKPIVIGVYDGNIVFNEISHFNTLSDLGMPLIQFQSKNYFNVAYGKFVYKRFFAEGAPKIIAPMFDPDLCGQRSDNESYWSEMIEKGFTVIETNNISSLVSYIDKVSREKAELSVLAEKAGAIDNEPYSQICQEKLSAALSESLKVISGISSLNQIQSSRSQLINAMNGLNVKHGQDTQKGALNITAGKIIAAVIVGSLILAAQIYVKRMQLNKDRKKRA